MSSKKKPFLNELCSDCYLSRKMKDWPTSVTLTKCVKCERIWRNKEWKYPADSLISAAVSQLLDKKGAPGRYNPHAQAWEGVFESGGSELSFSHPVTIEWQKTACPECNRAHSNYFEGIIQLRGDAAMVERAAKRLVKRIERKTFIPKMEDMHGGLDIYIGVKKGVAEILRQEGLDFVRSEKLSGEKQGKRLYRSSYLIRLGVRHERDAGPVLKVPKRVGWEGQRLKTSKDE